jgi:death-on-curing protein
MSIEPFFLTVPQVAALHRISLEQHGGQDGLRDEAAFKSAVQQPLNTWFYAQGDIFDVAAAYAFHMAESQAFLDGNKRTGMAAALTFLRLNGRSVPQNTEELHVSMIEISARKIGKPELAELFRKLAKRT